MTLLQMAGMYQAIASDGVRIPPRIVKATIAPDGTRTETPRPTASGWSTRGLRGCCATSSAPSSSATRRAFSGALAQPPPSTATRWPARPVTAQQINPGCGCYQRRRHWITFAGMAPADDPRYVIGIMMDAPTRNADGTPASLGRAAVPQHRRLADAQRENVPLAGPAGRC